jgi:hypothetical protein
MQTRLGTREQSFRASYKTSWNDGYVALLYLRAIGCKSPEAK